MYLLILISILILLVLWIDYIFTIPKFLIFVSFFYIILFANAIIDNNIGQFHYEYADISIRKIYIEDHKYVVIGELETNRYKTLILNPNNYYLAESKDTEPKIKYYFRRRINYEVNSHWLLFKKPMIIEDWEVNIGFEDRIPIIVLPSLL